MSIRRLCSNSVEQNKMYSATSKSIISSFVMLLLHCGTYCKNGLKNCINYFWKLYIYRPNNLFEPILFFALCHKIKNFTPIEGATNLYCDNEGIFENVVKLDSTLNKNQQGRTYYYCCQNVVAWIVRVSKEDSNTQLADIFAKCMNKPKYEVLSGNLMYWQFFYLMDVIFHLFLSKLNWEPSTMKRKHVNIDS